MAFIESLRFFVDFSEVRSRGLASSYHVCHVSVRPGVRVAQCSGCWAEGVTSPGAEPGPCQGTGNGEQVLRTGNACRRLNSYPSPSLAT